MSSDEASVAHVKPTQPDELERIKNEEYKIWKKQSPFLYDICISKAMPSPSATVQWFSDSSSVADSPFDTFSLLLSSSELFGGANTVFTAKCDLPRLDSDPEAISRLEHKNKELNIIELDKSISLDSGDFTYSARHSPFDNNLIAACGKGGFVKVFKNGDRLPGFQHHTRDVYDVSWSPHNESQLVSTGLDGTCALWDLNKATAPRVFAGDNSPGQAESVSQSLYAAQFAPINPNEIAIAGDSRAVQFWDVRTPLTKAARIITDAHATSITALDYSPLNEMLVATGSADGVVSLWDVRMSSASLIGLQADAGPVNALKWSPHEESVFATGGADAQVKVWDLSMHGLPQTAVEEEEGPPELMFIHGGHLGSISDLAWHPTLQWTLCSVSEDSLVGIWKIASAIVNAANDNQDNESSKDSEAAGSNDKAA